MKKLNIKQVENIISIAVPIAFVLIAFFDKSLITRLLSGSMAFAVVILYLYQLIKKD